MASVYPISINSNIDIDDPNMSYFGYTNFFIDATSNNVTVLLPTQPWDGCIFGFTRLDASANTVTLTATNSLTINGGGSVTLQPSQETYSIFFGTDWIAPIYTFTS